MANSNNLLMRKTKAELISMINDLINKINTIDKSSVKIKELEDEKTILNTKCTSYVGTISDLNSTLRNLSTEKSKLENSNKELEIQVNELRDIVDELTIAHNIKIVQLKRYKYFSIIVILILLVDMFIKCL